jgi:hypothetical protein
MPASFDCRSPTSATTTSTTVVHFVELGYGTSSAGLSRLHGRDPAGKSQTSV